MGQFFDTNIIIYAMQNGPKSPVALDLLNDGGTVSAQVLNETVHTMRRKFATPWGVLQRQLSAVRDLMDEIVPLTDRIHDSAVALAARDRLPFYDALILAAALEAGCDTLLSEDFQAGRRFGPLTVVNPFAV